MAAEKLRDLSQPIDVALLDATVAAFYGTGSKDEEGEATVTRGLLLIYCGSYKTILDMWLQVVHILSNTQSLNTKFFCFTGRRVLSNIDGMYCLLSNGTE
ncbi:putative armadillo-like helical protein [Helianthus annuus]|uniref:Armadillo-like helical protein n=1 Tax=Helianthus annuus TaxID=4232 RepID=A0A9K3DKX3_HELAN|nr:putative armadillo-like helical protein [Helianthus annuus]